MELTPLGAAILLAFGAGLCAVIYGSWAKTRWGINFMAVRCPKCGAVQAKARKPADAYEARWGGWTCPECGTKMDKWGRARGE